MKYVLVTGGVISGLGKGITASSIGVILKRCNYSVTAIKIDPYLNVDAGTMSPNEHGEVFVLDDGGEGDLDLGNYERFLDINLTKNHNITTGKIYQKVIEKERRGDYLGKTVQMIPHQADIVINWIEQVSKVPVDYLDNKEPEICIIELGGVVGDIESMLYIEALRQLGYKVGPQNFCVVHVSLVPTINGEQKTKPTQQSIKNLLSNGLQPHILACRCDHKLNDTGRSKMALFSQLPKENVIDLVNVSNVWKVPIILKDQMVHQTILDRFKLGNAAKLDIEAWTINLSDKVDQLKDQVRIATVGKYMGNADAYLSVTKALLHSSLACNLQLQQNFIEATHLESKTKTENLELYNKAWYEIKSAQGILIPGGFGGRATEGMFLAANYARTQKIPYLGICMGLQVSVVEFCRNVLNKSDANSTEWNSATSNPVVIFMPEISETHMGGTMRLGSRKTIFKTADCLSARLYQKSDCVFERHRHRYEVNPEYVQELERHGMKFVGVDESGKRMEIVEITGNPKEHPFYVSTQFHPEFKSRPGNPAPLFLGFVMASSKKLNKFFKGPFLESFNHTQHPIRTSSNSEEANTSSTVVASLQNMRIY